MLAVKATEDTLSEYNTMKLEKKYAAIIFKVKGGDIVVDQKFEKGAYAKDKKKAKTSEKELETVIAAIKKTGEPRFAVIDYQRKLAFVSWAPEKAKLKFKMVYSSCKEGFIQELVGLSCKIQGTDDSELNVKVVTEKTKSNV